MKDEFTLEELKKGVKNPFYDKLNTEIVVSLRNDVYEVFAEIAEQNQEEPAAVIRRCLTHFAPILKEHE